MAIPDLWLKIPPTEMQHDFGKIGITKSKINSSGNFNNNGNLKKSIISSRPLDAMTDAALCQAIFGPSIATPTGSTITGSFRKWNRRNEKGIDQAWEIRAASIDLKGEALLKALGIPNNSVAIVDTDNGIIAKRMKQGPPSSFTLFYCINNITRSDSAGKANTDSTDGKKVFSGLKGIICKAIVSEQRVLVNGQNELNMNYDVTNQMEQTGGVKTVTQTWTPTQGSGLTGFKVIDPHSQNNITVLSPIIDKILGGNSLLSPPPDVIAAFLQKRSGDQFQGWITKYLLKKITDPLNVIYWMWNNNGKGRPFKSEQQPLSIQALSASGQLGDIFTVTGDFPYLCFCVEVLGVSVLFREQNQIIYIRRVVR